MIPGLKTTSYSSANHNNVSDDGDDAVTTFAKDLIKTGTRRVVDEIAASRLGPIGPAAVELGVQAYHALSDKDD